MAEVNMYWPSVSTQHQIQERTRGWFETTVSTAAYNIQSTQITNQKGGMVLIISDWLAHRCFSRDYDILGRWMVISFQGRDGLFLRVVSAHIPQLGIDPYTVYQQHLQYYINKRNTKFPIKIFDDELTKMTGEWIDNGDQVILMIDANEGLHKNIPGIFRWRMEGVGINELILNQHPSLQSPPTRHPGTRMIYSIFGTWYLEVLRGGYAPFVGYTYHMLAWGYTNL